MTNIPESHKDLLELPCAALSTIGPGTRPQITVVWFVYEDDVFKLSLNTGRQKVRNMRVNPAATLLLADASWYRYLEVRGNTALEPDDGYEFADRLAGKYGGADLRTMDKSGESRVIVTLEPVRVNAVDLTGGRE